MNNSIDISDISIEKKLYIKSLRMSYNLFSSYKQNNNIYADI